MYKDFSALFLSRSRPSVLLCDMRFAAHRFVIENVKVVLIHQSRTSFLKNYSHMLLQCVTGHNGQEDGRLISNSNIQYLAHFYFTSWRIFPSVYWRQSSDYCVEKSSYKSSLLKLSLKCRRCRMYECNQV